MSIRRLPARIEKRTVDANSCIDIGIDLTYSHLTFVVSSTTFSLIALWPTHEHMMCLGSLHQFTIVGFCRHFKSPHSFHSIMHSCHCILFIPYIHVRQLLLLDFSVVLIRLNCLSQIYLPMFIERK